MSSSDLVRRLLVPLGLLVAGTASPAQEPAPVVAPAAASPTVLLRYRELSNREQLKFVMAGKPYTKAVGDMTVEFPAGAFPSAGLDPAVRTFCVEPLVPMYAGEVYPFAVDPLAVPVGFNLPDTPAGREQADRRARFVRELYGRFYQEVPADPAANAPAFQTALWELTQESEVPDGPMPFSLFAGTFRADYPVEADAPQFVRTAQRYVQTLTGDDSVFAANPTLANLELNRLTALRPVGGAVAGQSMLALRTAPAAVDTAGAAGGGGGPAVGGGLGGIPTGLGGGGLRGPGLGGPAVGGVGGGIGGGGFGGIGGGGVLPTTTGTTTTPTGATTEPPRAGPATTVVPGVPVAPPGSTGNVTTGASNQPQNPPTPTGTNTNNNNPPPPVVPAPAGVVLAAVGLAALGLRRLTGKAG